MEDAYLRVFGEGTTKVESHLLLGEAARMDEGVPIHGWFEFFDDHTMLSDECGSWL